MSRSFNSFNRDFDRDFDKSFSRFFKFAIGAWIVGALISLSMIVFACWVIVQILQHFAVI